MLMRTQRSEPINPTLPSSLVPNPSRSIHRQSSHSHALFPVPSNQFQVWSLSHPMASKSVISGHPTESSTTSHVPTSFLSPDNFLKSSHLRRSSPSIQLQSQSNRPAFGILISRTGNEPTSLRRCSWFRSVSLILFPLFFHSFLIAVLLAQ
jgi:hypothetical protein